MPGTVLVLYIILKQSLEGPIKGPECSRRLRLPDIETVGT